MLNSTSAISSTEPLAISQINPMHEMSVPRRKLSLMQAHEYSAKQVLLLSLAHFLTYVALLTFHWRKKTLYFEKLLSLECNFQLFSRIHTHYSIYLTTPSPYISNSLVCILKTVLQENSPSPLYVNKDKKALFFLDLPSPYCTFQFRLKSVLFLSAVLGFEKDFKIWAGYLQPKSHSLSPTHPWKAQVN